MVTNEYLSVFFGHRAHHDNHGQNKYAGLFGESLRTPLHTLLLPCSLHFLSPALNSLSCIPSPSVQALQQKRFKQALSSSSYQLTYNLIPFSLLTLK